MELQAYSERSVIRECLHSRRRFARVSAAHSGAAVYTLLPAALRSKLPMLGRNCRDPWLRKGQRTAYTSAWASRFLSVNRVSDLGYVRDYVPVEKGVFPVVIRCRLARGRRFSPRNVDSWFCISRPLGYGQVVASGKYRQSVQDADDDGSVLDVSTGCWRQHSANQGLGQRDLGQVVVGLATIEPFEGGTGMGLSPVLALTG